MISSKIIRNLTLTVSSNFNSFIPTKIRCRKLSAVYAVICPNLVNSSTSLPMMPVHFNHLNYSLRPSAVGIDTQRFEMQKRFYANFDRKNIDLKIAKSKKMLSDNIECKRLQLRERKKMLVQEIREKKQKVQEKVKEMEDIVERENILTIPNLLCVARGCLAPYVGYVIVQEHFHLAIGLLAVAGVSDLLDGFIARNWKSQASTLGSFLDPMADKLLVGSLVISLSLCHLFPIWLSSMVILRDVFLIIAGFVVRFISLPKPRTLTRYFDATHVTAKLKPTFTSKVNTAVQLITIAVSLGAPIYEYIDHSALVGMWYFTGFTTIAAALSYIMSKDTYQLIKNRKKSTKKST